MTPDGLRFDFPLERGLTDDERRAIEDEVRRVVREDRPVTAAFMCMREAIDAGADAFFDEKYGETVRTVRVDGYSHELCGGTHCRATGQIGSFVIIGERSIGTGMRRIEALTGDGADAWLAPRLAALARGRGDAGAASIGGPAGPDRGPPGRAARGKRRHRGRCRRVPPPTGRARRPGGRDRHRASGSSPTPARTPRSTR